LILAPLPGFALEPREVVVIVNSAVPASRAVADHYLAQRGVPKENVVELALPAGEDISRDDYDRKLAGPLRDALRDRKDKVKCLLTVYGVPLRVGPKQPTDAEKAAAAEVTKQIESADPADKPRLEARRMVLSHRESTAAVDSELMLLWWPAYHLARWQPNPLYWQVAAAKRKAAPPVLLTARLDGPTPEIAKRLADDAAAAEADGLAGNAYVDARGIKFDVNNPSENGGYGYGGYDESMREAAGLLKAAGLPTTLDDRPDLFARKSCPNAAIYCGWYALSNYRDCCTFSRGAVAWHLASGEAVTLRGGTKAWCPNLLAAGAAVTLGPVNEPYTVAFPKPAEFFGLLLTGKYALAEVHARTQHFASWMTVLVGDPLYNPFGKKPLVKEEDVVASPKGGRVLFK
jgi:uncharacterized protein (TIGR03790 family)